MLLNAGAEPFGQDLSLIAGRFPRQYDELFPTVSIGGVRGAKLQVHRGGELLKSLVPPLVAEGVVELLEVVDVEHDHGQRALVSTGALAFQGQVAIKTPPVGEAREGVGLAQFLRPTVQARRLDRCSGMHGQSLQNLQAAIGEKTRLWA